MKKNYYGKYSFFKNIPFLFFGKSSFVLNDNELVFSESGKKVSVKLCKPKFWTIVQGISDYILYIFLALELSIYFAYLSGPTIELYLYLSPYVFLPLLFLLYYWKSGYQRKTVSQKIFIQYLLTLFLLGYAFFFVVFAAELNYTYKITQIVFLFCLSIFCMLAIGEYDKIKTKGEIFKGTEENIIFICFEKNKNNKKEIAS